MSEQHFITNLTPHRALLARLSLGRRNVLEVGAGHGELTGVIAEHAASVAAYEIDADLRPLPGAEGLIRFADATTQDLSFLGPSWLLISNPPYALLPWCLELIVSRGICGAVLMTSERKAPLLRDFGFRHEFTLSGADFAPAARGNHHVMSWFSPHMSAY